jgi:hypothetical protein
MRLMVLDLPVPDHTQMSRRATQLPVTIPRKERQEPIHLVVDSTGLKIYSEGEWKVRQHGVGNRRTWGKVYLAVDGHAKDVIGVEVTTVDWSSRSKARLNKSTPMALMIHAMCTRLRQLGKPG